jgi:hypothetical protein
MFIPCGHPLPFSSFFSSARNAHEASVGWTYSDLETLIGQDEGGVGGSELGGRHYC